MSSKQFFNKLVCFAFFIKLFQAAYGAPAAESASIRTINIERILVLNIDSSINPATLNYIENAYKKTKDENYDLVLIKLNTPGGLVTTTKKIMTLIGESDFPTAIWVSPEGASATSAGAIIASSAHVLFMANGTNIGAATPIQMSKDIESKDLRNKAINDLVALVTSLAEARGRNTKLFEKIISEAASYTSQEALKENLIEGIANSNKDVLNILNDRKINLKGEEVQLKVTEPQWFDMEWDLGQRLLNIFANPNAAYILFLIGAALIYLEIQAPGGFLAGLFGLIFLLLSGVGFQILPVNFGALGLLLISFMLFVAEAYVTSYGLLSLAGVASLVTGSLFLFRTDNAYISLSMEVVLSAVSTIIAFILFIGFYILKDRQRGKTKDNYYSMVGKPCVISSIQDSGQNEAGFSYQVKVEGEIWKARSENKFEIGQTAVIVADYDQDMFLQVGEKE